MFPRVCVYEFQVNTRVLGGSCAIYLCLLRCQLKFDVARRRASAVGNFCIFLFCTNFIWPEVDTMPWERKNWVRSRPHALPSCNHACFHLLYSRAGLSLYLSLYSLWCFSCSQLLAVNTAVLRVHFPRQISIFNITPMCLVSRCDSWFRNLSKKNEDKVTSRHPYLEIFFGHVFVFDTRWRYAPKLVDFLISKVQQGWNGNAHRRDSSPHDWTESWHATLQEGEGNEHVSSYAGVFFVLL